MKVKEKKQKQKKEKKMRKIEKYKKTILRKKTYRLGKKENKN